MSIDFVDASPFGSTREAWSSKFDVARSALGSLVGYRYEKAALRAATDALRRAGVMGESTSLDPCRFSERSYPGRPGCHSDCSHRHCAMRGVAVALLAVLGDYRLTPKAFDRGTPPVEAERERLAKDALRWLNASGWDVTVSYAGTHAAAPLYAESAASDVCLALGVYEKDTEAIVAAARMAADLCYKP